jgi:hypothetical protein
MTDAPDQQRVTRRDARVALLAGLTTVAIGVAVAAGWALATRAGQDSATADRQAEVAAKGRQVMPFDLERTTHVFADRPDGGTQTVIADNPADSGQVTLIRGHLREEAAKFTRGDFTDPATIHGEAMPGLAQLKQGANRIQVRYRDLPDGARITYTATDPTLVRALHAWFRAQSDDHGGHAEHTSS